MVIDDVRNLSAYKALDDALSQIAEAECMEVPVFRSFQRNPKNTVVFTVEKGSITVSTSWRESPDSLEALAAAHVVKGNFVLFLPGEAYLVKLDSEDTEATMRVLESYNGS